jgi:hypothetical protein
MKIDTFVSCAVKTDSLILHYYLNMEFIDKIMIDRMLIKKIIKRYRNEKD